MAAASGNGKNGYRKWEKEDRPVCGAHKRGPGGGICQMDAGRGTSHKGWGHCSLHGGSTPNGTIHAAKLEAAFMVAEYAEFEPDVEPHDVLLRMVRLAAGLVAFYARKHRELIKAEGEEALAVQHREEIVGSGKDADGYTVKTSTQTALHLWGRLLEQAIDRAAKIAKLALDAGVEERRVRLAEQWGDELADLLRRVIADLGLDEQQLARAPEIVERNLRLIEGGVAA